MAPGAVQAQAAGPLPDDDPVIAEDGPALTDQHSGCGGLPGPGVADQEKAFLPHGDPRGMEKGGPPVGKHPGQRIWSEGKRVRACNWPWRKSSVEGW